MALLAAACAREVSLPQLLLEIGAGSRPAVGRLSDLAEWSPFVPRPEEPRLEPGAAGLRGLGGSPAGYPQAMAALEPGEAARWQGLISLARGHYGRAIRELEAAAADGAADARPHSDLAAAYLTRGLTAERPFDFIKALEATRMALALDASSEAAWFNRALAFTLLHLDRQARFAWDEYRRLERDERWLDEASTHRPAEDQPTRTAEWRLVELRLTEPGGASSLSVDAEGIVARFPFFARMFVEERLFGLWAEAALRGEAGEAERLVQVAAAIGRELRAQRGDHLVAEAVAAIRAAAPPAGSAAALRSLALAHRSFADGMAAYYAQQLGQAAEALGRARRAFRGAASPMAKWSSFYLAVCTFYGDKPAATAMFEKLAAESPPELYPAVAARSQWLLGTIAAMDRRYQEALDRYAKAADGLSSSSGEGGAAFVNVLLAETHDPLGEIDLAWRYRARAFAALARSGNARRLHSTITEAAAALQRQGYPEEARPFLEELLAHAREWEGHPYAVAEAHALRAANELLLRQPPAATLEIRLAREALKSVEATPSGEPNDLVRWLENWLLVYEGWAVIELEPARAAEILGRAFERQSASGYRFDRERYLPLRARAYELAGEEQLAAADDLATIELYEQARAGLLGESARLGYFRYAQPAFERLIRRRLEDGDLGAALELSERARSRFLLDLRGSGAARPFRHDAVLGRSLPAGLAIVEYALFDDRAVAWVIDSAATRLVELSASSESLLEPIAALRARLRLGPRAQEIQQIAASLYDRLVRPLDLDAASVDRLIFVPDGALLELPFSVLYDAASGRFLIEDFEISVAPSLSLLLLKSEEPAPEARSEVVVLGSSEPVRQLALPGLPQAVVEAGRVASLYGVQPITGPRATRARLLERMPTARVVHVAAHVLANSEVPGRSQLVLAADPDGGGALRAEEIWGQRLAGIDLVVLSACQSMVGHAAGREAVYGLAGGFVSAGVGEVVATRWPISDRGTPELMARFHERYRSGAPAAAAWRGVAVEALRGQIDGAESPGHWGAFTVLTGELPGGRARALG